MELFDEIDEHLIDWLLELNEVYESMQNLIKNGQNNEQNNELKEEEEKEDDKYNIEEKSFFFNSEKDAEEQIESCLQLMHDYILENPTEISEPDFEETMIDELKNLIEIQYNTFFWLATDKELFILELEEIIEYALSLFYIYFMPVRSFSNTFPNHFLEKWNKTSEQQLTNKLKDLKEAPQPKQRTKEWYAFRYNLITASNAYKAMDPSQSVQNQLIYEKCSAIKIEEQKEQVLNDDVKIITVLSKPNNVNINSPLHWGQKYEPVSVLLYEDMYDTKVGDYGCIRHNKYSFLGASPDGINDVLSDNCIGSSRYGRMLEIKNIVNREIDGIPKKEYWIQMQLQMEICNLWECDFLETKFIEIEEEEYEKTQKKNIEEEEEEQEEHQKNEIITPNIGIIMYFATLEGNPIYVYKPLHMTQHYFQDIWFNEQIYEQQKLGRCWIKNIFWKLEEYSCVLVLRNQLWFQQNICFLEQLWITVLKERDTGEWINRGPQKRIKKEKELDKIESISVKFDKETGKFISI